MLLLNRTAVKTGYNSKTVLLSRRGCFQEVVLKEFVFRKRHGSHEMHCSHEEYVSRKEIRFSNKKLKTGRYGWVWVIRRHI
jgi:hypothetical protein